ncbi:MAG: hypothetical protein ACREMY_33815, partial [bacterium]
MNDYRFTAEVARSTRDKDAELWGDAALRERAYTSPEGVFRVGADWEPLLSDVFFVRIVVL